MASCYPAIKLGGCGGILVNLAMYVHLLSNPLWADMVAIVSYDVVFGQEVGPNVESSYRVCASSHVLCSISGNRSVP